MDRWGRTCGPDVQSQPESLWSLRRTLWGRPSRSAGLAPSLDGAGGAAVGPGGGLRSLPTAAPCLRKGWEAGAASAGARPAARSVAVWAHPPPEPLFNSTTGCFSLPLVNAGLLPSRYSPSISLATRPFMKVTAMNAESLGFTVVR